MTEKEYRNYLGREWYKKNRAKKIAKVKSWQASNLDKVRSYKTKWNNNNKEYLAQWYKDKNAA